MIRALIIDDNKIARSILSRLASAVNDMTIVGECSDAMEAYTYMMDNPVDLLLLDIEMPGMSGLELTRNLGNARPVIIFTTSKKEYAAEAFELNVADYLVKPVVPARFEQAMAKAKEILESNREEVKWSDDEFIFIRDAHIVRRLKVDDILYAEAMGDYVKLHTPQKFYAIHTTLKSVEERLPAGKFIRIHRSYIVAVSKIDTLEDGGAVVAHKFIPIADAYRKVLTKRMNIL
ncbi:LytTR family DNA-binding domain-containing protein [Cytophagaceae bacterium DM2B3-1]|uniref:LytTR family DNA-binding domain-containing protein n=1 Tax=Xanthocytophaga flava TaxID=3048013 RepID=A0ABT7CWI3_9BACT|nr:LytTR family DNA-binding domain-containing protein [Xanthocytophaga flavus]MDJ1467018.1 LytTR family DNA-binding domain-containing protein [Xanthocytophaga flavus]MDJ1498124.1 LytTR family DNA-binding domain-containing protein [Xanthocytophaga flavus]